MSIVMVTWLRFCNQLRLKQATLKNAYKQYFVYRNISRKQPRFPIYHHRFCFRMVLDSANQIIYILRVKLQYATIHVAGTDMIKSARRKKRSKRTLIALSPVFLAIFSVGWILAWMGQLGKVTKTNTNSPKLSHTQFTNKSLNTKTQLKRPKPKKANRVF